ncbi:MarR family transcriptional regulator [Pseudarthrobacter sp. Fe7]|nr:MarR family transcriptional regulator [Pseudarthrobacter sp. Fe7]
MAAIRGDDGNDASLSRVITALAVLDKGLLDGLSLALSEADISVEQWRILDLVAQLGAPTMGELAAASGLPNASLSRAVNALEDSAAVFRLPSPEDRRRITVRVSDHGAERLDRMTSIVKAWETTTADRLGQDAVTALTSAVQLVGQRLNQEGKQPAQPAR